MSRYFLVALIMVFVLLQALSSRAQQGIQWTWPSQLHVGATLMKLKSDSSSNWHQQIGTHLMLTSGIGVRFGQSGGFEMNLGLHMNSMQLTNAITTYSVQSLSFMPGALAYGLIPLSERHSSFMRVGLEFGRLFQASDSLKADVSGDKIIFDTYAHKRNYWTPFIGFTKWNERNVFSFGVGFQFTNNTNYFMRAHIVQKDGGYANFEGMANALTLSVNYAYTFKTHERRPDPPVVVPDDANELVMRKQQALPSMNTKRRTVHLEIWDNGDEDRDSISIQLNGEFILANYELTSRKKRIKLNLREGENRLIFMAHNEGLFPPNTAHCQVRMGRSRKTLTVASDLESNVGLVIIGD